MYILMLMKTIYNIVLDKKLLFSCFVIFQYIDCIYSLHGWLSYGDLKTVATLSLGFTFNTSGKGAFTLTRVPVTGYSYKFHSYE